MPSSGRRLGGTELPAALSDGRSLDEAIRALEKKDRDIEAKLSLLQHSLKTLGTPSVEGALESSSALGEGHQTVP